MHKKKSIPATCLLSFVCWMLCGTTVVSGDFQTEAPVNGQNRYCYFPNSGLATLRPPHCVYYAASSLSLSLSSTLCNSSNSLGLGILKASKYTPEETCRAAFGRAPANRMRFAQCSSSKIVRLMIPSENKMNSFAKTSILRPVQVYVGLRRQPAGSPDHSN